MPAVTSPHPPYTESVCLPPEGSTKMPGCHLPFSHHQGQEGSGSFLSTVHRLTAYMSSELILPAGQTGLNAPYGSEKLHSQGAGENCDLAASALSTGAHTREAPGGLTPLHNKGLSVSTHSSWGCSCPPPSSTCDTVVSQAPCPRQHEGEADEGMPVPSTGALEQVTRPALDTPGIHLSANPFS